MQLAPEEAGALPGTEGFNAWTEFWR